MILDILANIDNLSDGLLFNESDLEEVKPDDRILGTVDQNSREWKIFSMIENLNKIISVEIKKSMARINTSAPNTLQTMKSCSLLREIWKSRISNKFSTTKDVKVRKGRFIVEPFIKRIGTITSYGLYGEKIVEDF